MKTANHVRAALALTAAIAAPAALSVESIRGVAFEHRIASLLCLGLIAGLISHELLRWQALQKFERVFGRRTRQDPDAVLATLSTTEGLNRRMFSTHWRECAAALEVPPDLVRAEDRFDVELAPAGFFDSLADRRDYLVQRLLRRWPDDVGVAEELRSIATFGELVSWVTRRAQARDADAVSDDGR